MSLKRYSSSMNPVFPVPGDVDAIDFDCKIEERGTKVAVKTRSRWLSVFPSQLRPIADFFESNPDILGGARVEWVEAKNQNNQSITVAKVTPNVPLKK